MKMAIMGVISFVGKWLQLVGVKMVVMGVISFVGKMNVVAWCE
jgi:hypothetical protein